MTRRRWSALVAGVLISLLLAGCGGNQTTGELEMAPASQLPDDLRDSPSNVQEAYRFAIANQELLEQIPCFCGCVAGGHESNYNCYVAEDGGPGTILQYDYHALG